MRLYKIIGTAALALILAWLGLNRMAPAPKAPLYDIFTTITGAQIDLKTLRGKPVLVTFWATDCPGCIAEIPQLLKLYRQFHPRGLELIAVNMYYDPPSHVIDMVQAKQLPYPVALDLTAQHARTFGDVQLIPSSFLIAPDGTVGRQTTGPIDVADMQARITAYLK